MRNQSLLYRRLSLKLVVSANGAVSLVCESCATSNEPDATAIDADVDRPAESVNEFETPDA
jgi:hypothetical protein